MVREFGGELTLRRTPQPGACFLIRLPAWPIETDPSATKMPTLAGATVGAAHRRKILLVDDDPPVRRALRRMLAKHHQVDEAGALHEALEKIGQCEYDVLVTDLVMSHGGGPALIEQLKAMNSPVADHVVVVSGMAPDAASLPYPRITKPCSEEELLRAIESVAG
jgi:CheY-like chemotaxis protein